MNFWMWVVAFLGASTAYVESALGQIYKEEDEGQFRGGPAYYFEKALGQKWYAWLFALSTIVAVGLLLPTVQSNAIGAAVELAFGGGATIETAIGSTPFVVAQSDENKPSITWWADGSAETWMVFWMLVAVYPTLDKGMNEEKRHTLP